MKKIVLCLILLTGIALTGCWSGKSESDTPVFTLSWSEYPSWSVFGLAHEKGIINGNEGEQSELEKHWNVDLVLKQADYDTTITQYATAASDAVCMTNMDALNPSLGRKSTVILPTSTSAGADALIAVGVDNIEQLKGQTVYGLEKSVSEYAFVRGLETKGLNPADYKFSNMDPAAAAQALQTNQPSVKAIMVWNPFVLQTLRTRPDAKRILDSSVIPGEIVDSVVFANDSLHKPGGQRAASCIVEAFYRTNSLLVDDAAFVALGAKFSNLGAADMRQCCKETMFYNTPELGQQVFNDDFRQRMDRIVRFCVDRGIVKEAPTIGYRDGSSQLNFDPVTYIKAMRNK